MNSLNCGGEENFVMNLYRSIDRQSIRVYFCIPDLDGQKQYLLGYVCYSARKYGKILKGIISRERQQL